MSNYIPQIMNIIGVECNEEFFLSFSGSNSISKEVYYINNNGVLCYSPETFKKYHVNPSLSLLDILNGAVIIVKKQEKQSSSRFIPKLGEKYYIPACLPNKKIEIFELIWTDDSADILFYEKGLVFKTKKEAENNKYKVEGGFSNGDKSK